LNWVLQDPEDPHKIYIYSLRDIRPILVYRFIVWAMQHHSSCLNIAVCECVFYAA